MAKSIPIVRKLSVKIMLGKKPKKPDANEVDEDGVKWLCRFYGVAMGTKVGEGDKGQWVALTGSFVGINTETGETKRAGTLFVPNVVLDMIMPHVLPGNKDFKGVEFGFDIGVKEDDESVTGYVYSCKPCLQMSESDPLEALSKRIEMPALPAPEETAKGKRRSTAEAA